jgi:SnoaL-like domain
VIELLSFCTGTFRKSLAKVTRPAAAPPFSFYTEDCVLYVPPGVFVGHDALDKFAGDLRATHPHFVYTPHGEPQALHNGGILAWGSGPKGEAPDYTGLDVVIIRDGKIAALYVFLNPKFA